MSEHDRKSDTPRSPAVPGSTPPPLAATPPAHLPLAPNEAPTPSVPVAPPGSPTPAPAASSPIDDIERRMLEAQVVEILRTVFDPEIPVNIYELGMIYKISVRPPGSVTVEMTLTSPMCPVAGSLPGEVQAKIQGIPAVTSAKVELVWEPPWNPSLMSEGAKLQLGMM